MKNTATNKMRFLTAVMAIASFAMTVCAQDPLAPQTGTMKGAVLKGRAPVNKQILRVKLPKAEEATLKNGLRVVVLENHRVPTFSMEMVVLSGGLSDPADLHGLAQVTAALLREGTAKHTSRELAEQLDTIGATIGANSGLASFTTSVTSAGLVENFDQVLALFAEVIRTPKFPTEEVERYKSRTVSGQGQIRTGEFSGTGASEPGDLWNPSGVARLSARRRD